MTKALILAGGKGTRLKPYTTSFPKPLMPVGEKPILEILIRDLAKNGIMEIIIAVGHLSEMIRVFFGDGSKYGLNITYSQENQPLGTIGPLSLVKNAFSETFLAINGDTLTNLDYHKLIDFHQLKKCIATIALSKREININYGVAEMNTESQIEKYIEKPSLQKYVGTGICVFEPEIFNYIPKDKRFDLPDLLTSLIAKKKEINAYIHPGYWFDIGRPSDYEMACKFIEEKDQED